MSDTEKAVKRGRGRPAVDSGPVKEATKRPAPASPKKVAKESNGEADPAKRGRGRPPGKRRKKAKPYVKKGNAQGRGRPPKNAEKKPEKEESEEEDE